MTHRAGAVLAGGSSRRMGTAKEWIDVDGAPLVAHPLAGLAALGVDELITVGGDVAALASVLEAVAPGAVTCARPDWYPGAGPLGGVITALGSVTAPEVAILASDMPRVDPVALEHQWRALHADPDAHAAVAVVEGRIHPLHAVFRRRALPDLVRAFEGGERSLLGALVGLDVVRVILDATDSVQNWNAPADVPCKRHQEGGPT